MSRRSRRGPGPIPIVFAVAGVATAVMLAGGVLRETLRKPGATRTAQAQFEAATAVMTRKLRQPEPLEFGAVWATHAGRVCGLINGKGSFGGKIGMIPFFIDTAPAGQPVTRYSLDTDPSAFGLIWSGCASDMWIELVKGSAEQGYCATREGASRCHWTSERRPG